MKNLFNLSDSGYIRLLINGIIFFIFGFILLFFDWHVAIIFILIGLIYFINIFFFKKFKQGNEKINNDNMKGNKNE